MIYPAFGFPIVEVAIIIGGILVSQIYLSISDCSNKRRLAHLCTAIFMGLSVIIPLGAMSGLCAACASLIISFDCAHLFIRLNRHFCVSRWRESIVTHVSSLIELLAWFYYLKASLWFVASRYGTGVLGHDIIITTLTAAHFVYAGFGIVVMLRGLELILPKLQRRRCYQISAWIARLGPIIVAIGIQWNGTIEFISAVILACSVFGLAVTILLEIKTSFSRSLRLLQRMILIGLGGLQLVPIWTMLCAMGYALRDFLPDLALPIPMMVKYHGQVNAFAYVLPSLVLIFFVRHIAIRNKELAR